VDNSRQLIFSIKTIFVEAIFNSQTSLMTQKEIQEAIDAIRQASFEANKSKESARQFLIDAGIIKDDKKQHSAPPKK
jgi:hypothetical protein